MSYLGDVFLFVMSYFRNVIRLYYISCRKGELYYAKWEIKKNNKKTKKTVGPSHADIGIIQKFECYWQERCPNKIGPLNGEANERYTFIWYIIINHSW